MTPAQETAITYHCRLAAECVNLRFATKVRNSISIVLTVNTGYE